MNCFYLLVFRPWNLPITYTKVEVLTPSLTSTPITQKRLMTPLETIHEWRTTTHNACYTLTANLLNALLSLLNWTILNSKENFNEFYKWKASIYGVIDISWTFTLLQLSKNDIMQLGWICFHFCWHHWRQIEK